MPPKSLMIKKSAPAASRMKTKSRPSKPKQSRPSFNGVSSMALSKPLTSTGMDKLGVYMEITGREFVDVVTTGASAPLAGAVVYRRENIVAPNNTRLKQFAKLYYRWKPIRYQYEFIPSSPTTTAGQFAYGIDPDPTSTNWSVSTPDNIARILALNGQDLKQVWQPALMSLPSESDYTSLWCDPVTTTQFDAEDRLAAAGQAIIVCVVPGAIPANAVLGTLLLNYKVRLYLPRLGDASASSTIEFKYGCNQTTSNDFFDHSSGGATPSQNPLNKIISDMAIKPSGISVESVVDGVNVVAKAAKIWGLFTSESKVDIKDIDESHTGLPFGKYVMDVAVVSNTVDPDTVMSFGDIAGQRTDIAGNNTWSTSTVGSYLAPDGVDYKFFKQLHISFEIDGGGGASSRGFVDYRITRVASDPSDLDGVYVFVRFSVNGTNDLFDYSAIPLTSLTRNIRPVGARKFHIDDLPDRGYVVSSTPPPSRTSPMLHLPTRK